MPAAGEARGSSSGVFMRAAFVTGGTGFIGRNLIDALLARGVEVRCLVRSPSRADHLRRAGVRTVTGSLGDVVWSCVLADGCVFALHDDMRWTMSVLDAATCTVTTATADTMPQGPMGTSSVPVLEITYTSEVS